MPTYGVMMSSFLLSCALRSMTLASQSKAASALLTATVWPPTPVIVSPGTASFIVTLPLT